MTKERIAEMREHALNSALSVHVSSMMNPMAKALLPTIPEGQSEDYYVGAISVISNLLASGMFENPFSMQTRGLIALSVCIAHRYQESIKDTTGAAIWPEDIGVTGNQA